MSVKDYPPEQLVARAVRNARPRQDRYPEQRWICVQAAFGLGSTYAKELCRLHGLDPDEILSNCE